MKKIDLYPLVLASLWLAGCHPDDLDGSKAASLAFLKRVEAVSIAQEISGDPPPKGSGSWRAYWHSRFVTMQGVDGNFGEEDIAFIKRQRAIAGLPPVN